MYYKLLISTHEKYHMGTFVPTIEKLFKVIYLLGIPN